MKEGKNFFKVPNCIFSHGLKPRELAVYCCLSKYSNRNSKSCFPSRKTIARDCCMDRKTVDNAIKTLESKGLVKKEHRYRADGTLTSNLYHLTDLLDAG